MTPPERPRLISESVRAFRSRQYLLFWSAALVSNVGIWLSALTVPYVLFQLTGSALWTSFTTVAAFLPSFFLGPTAGWLADRFDRRKVLIGTQSGMAFGAVGLWAVWMLDLHEVGPLLFFVLVQGIFQGLNMPAWQSFVHDLVPREDLQSAVTLNSMQFNAARSIGPAIAGAVITLLGPGGSFGLNALSFVAVLTALLVIRSARPSVHGRPKLSFAGALRYLPTQPGIVVAVIVAVLVSALVNPLMQFTVVFAASIFNVGPWPLGLMNAALGLGSILVVPLAAGSAVLSRAATVRLGLVLLAIGLVGFGLAPNWPVSAIALIVVGAGFLAAISATNTALQLIVAEPYRGRVMAIRIMAYTLAYPVGALVSGALSDAFGPRPIVIGAGVIMLIAWALVAFNRGRFSLGRLDDPYDDSLDGTTSAP
ncbi:MAG: MFS transporter [Propionibacteriaceae bacterium]|nr:MFS transporter [Propionibacteriaceae bacterium]